MSSPDHGPASDVNVLVAPSVTDDEREGVRVAVYMSFSNNGRSPSTPYLMREAFVTAPQVRRALLDLHASRDLVLDGDLKAAWETGLDVLGMGQPYRSSHEDEALGLVVLAHPFSGVNLGFSVMGAENVFWGGCAWDAFALPHLLPWEAPCLVATRCPACRAPIAVDVTNEYPPLAGPAAAPIPADREAPTTAPTPAPGPVAHFATPMKDAWTDVVKTCSMQNLFCSPHCVEVWCRREGRRAGYTMDIDTLWRLARGWYAGRLKHGYKRREPAQAKEYFRQAGLRGPFWGLEEE